MRVRNAGKACQAVTSIALPARWEQRKPPWHGPAGAFRARSLLIAASPLAAARSPARRRGSLLGGTGEAQGRGDAKAAPLGEHPGGGFFAEVTQELGDRL